MKVKVQESFAKEKDVCLTLSLVSIKGSSKLEMF